MLNIEDSLNTLSTALTVLDGQTNGIQYLSLVKQHICTHPVSNFIFYTRKCHMITRKSYVFFLSNAESEETNVLFLENADEETYLVHRQHFLSNRSQLCMSSMNESDEQEGSNTVIFRTLQHFVWL